MAGGEQQTSKEVPDPQRSIKIRDKEGKNKDNVLNDEKNNSKNEALEEKDDRTKLKHQDELPGQEKKEKLQVGKENNKTAMEKIKGKNK